MRGLVNLIVMLSCLFGDVLLIGVVNSCECFGFLMVLVVCSLFGMIVLGLNMWFDLLGCFGVCIAGLMLFLYCV